MSLFLNIEKQLGSFRLKVRFEAENEVLALLGASGCGKSMTLRCIAGIERPDRGRIVLDGVTLFDSEQHICLSPQERRTGLLFQNYALFPHMTVLQNLQAGAQREKDPARRQALIGEMIQRFHLTGLEQRYPSQLSGGQQQRTALARILVSSPNILLLDEPFSALDSHLRFRLEQELRDVIRTFGKTVILVSHDRDEVFRLSDQIAVLDNGQVSRMGSREQVFADPGTRSAAILTGCKNISRIRRLDDTHVRALDWGIDLAIPSAENASHVGIRMHGIVPASGPEAIPCRVTEVIENPFSITVMLLPEGAGSASPIGWELEKSVWASMPHDRVEIAFPPESLLLLRD